jgi:TonB-linked SusC/RagA family outer membrane protein
MHNSKYILSRWRILLIIMLLIIGGNSVYTQNSEVASSRKKGVVLDSYGNPISNVEIGLKGSEAVTTTNEAGEFDFTFNTGDVIVFKHSNFYVNLKRVKAKDVSKEKPRFFLVERYIQQPDSINVLYGKQGDDEYLGAVSTIYTDQLTSAMSNTLVSSMAGRLPGLYVEQFSGFRNPSYASNTQGAIGGNTPVTGVTPPSDNTQFNMQSRGTGFVTVIDGIQRDVYSLDPEMIESVSIQKDALSSILLGMRSSRGVLNVTTKEPSDNGFRLSFTGRYGIQSSVITPDPLAAHQYAYLLNEALTNDGKDAAYDNDAYQAFKDGTRPYLYPNNNWYDVVLESSAPTNSYNLNLSGGDKTAKYLVSLGYFNQEGLFKTSSANSYDTNLEFERYLINSKLNVDVTEEFKVGLTIIGRIENGNQPGASRGSVLNDIHITPNGAYPVYNPDGSYGGNVSYPRNIMAQTVASGYIQDKTKDAIANITLDYDMGNFVEGLTFNTTSNLSTQAIGALIRDKRNMVYELVPGEEEAEDAYVPFGAVEPQNNGYSAVANVRQWYGKASFKYVTHFGDHNLSAKIHGDRKVTSVNYDLPMQPANVAATGKYDFGKKYFVEAAVNNSYFNRYMPGERWGLFYAFGLGWDLQKENFLSNAGWLNQLKLRAVYGNTGNGVENSGYYIWRQTYYSSWTENTYSQGESFGLGPATNESTPLANTNITWEKAHKLNVGADVAMFNDKLQLSANYYYDYLYDLLQIRGKDIALAGAPYPAENIGEKAFFGTELSLTYQDNVGDFNYYLTANWSQNHSVVKFIDEQFRPKDYNKRTGQSNGAWFGLVADGFYDSVEEIENSPGIEGYQNIPGDLRYKDLNKDGIINEYDHTIIGNDKPLTYYGLTVGFNYKGLDFNVLFQGVYNRDIYLGDNTFMQGFQSVGQGYGQAYTHMLDRWTPETKETATLPRLSAGGNAYNLNPNYWWTSKYVKSGDYFRVKDINLAYTLPASVTNRFLGGTRLKFFVSAQNLFTASDFDLVDPEVRFTSYPLQKVVSTGVNIKF